MHLSVSPLVCVIGDAVWAPGSHSYHFPSAELLSGGSIYFCARRDKGMNDPCAASVAPQGSFMPLSRRAQK